MHELSVALNIVDYLNEYVRENKISSVLEIEMEIGSLAGVDLENFKFMLPFATKGSLFEKAEYKINEVKAMAKCQNCSMVYEINELYDMCPSCHSFVKEIVQGKELRIKSILAE
jgi:hydrogenase nickel incorporation protein HypA/HybF